MFNLYKAAGVYYTDDSYYSSYPFPVEWMELFDDRGRKKSKEAFENCLMENTVKYVPIITAREIFDVRLNKRPESSAFHYSKASLPKNYCKPELETPPSLLLYKRASISGFKRDESNKSLSLNKDKLKHDLKFDLHDKMKRRLTGSVSSIHTRKMTTTPEIRNSKIDSINRSKVNSLSSTRLTNEILSYLNKHKILFNRNENKRYKLKLE